MYKNTFTFGEISAKSSNKQRPKTKTDMVTPKNTFTFEEITAKTEAGKKPDKFETSFEQYTEYENRLSELSKELKKQELLLKYPDTTTKPADVNARIGEINTEIKQIKEKQSSLAKQSAPVNEEERQIIDSAKQYVGYEPVQSDMSNQEKLDESFDEKPSSNTNDVENTKKETEKLKTSPSASDANNRNKGKDKAETERKSYNDRANISKQNSTNFFSKKEEEQQVKREQKKAEEEQKATLSFDYDAKIAEIDTRLDSANARYRELTGIINAHRGERELDSIYNSSVSEQGYLYEEIEALKNLKEAYKKAKKYGGVVNEDDFIGQFKSNYRTTDISRDMSKSANDLVSNKINLSEDLYEDYDATGNPEMQRAIEIQNNLRRESNEQQGTINKEATDVFNELSKTYQINNAEALDEEGRVLPWISKSAAGYLPQFFDQAKAQVEGGAAGFIAGAAIGQPKKGAQIGASIASGVQEYEVMRGMVYMNLIEAGVDEETAIAAANDEALISGIIEAGSTAVGWMFSGKGKALDAIGNAAIKSVAKGSINAGTKYLARLATNKTANAVAKPLWRKGLDVGIGILGNVASEELEEFSQEGVSIANRERAMRGETGKLNLVSNAGKTVWDAVSGKNPEALSQMNEARKEGGIIGLLFGGSQTVVNNVVTHYANAKTIEEQNEIADTIINDKESLDALIEEGKASGKGTVSEKIATEVEKARENGTVTREQVKRLIASNEVYINAEEMQNEETDTFKRTVRNIESKQNQVSELDKTLDALSAVGEELEVDDVKKATGFGDYGAKLVSDLVRDENVTFTDAKRAVATAYLAGFTGLDGKKASFETDTQINAFTAGKADRITQDTVAREKAKKAAVYDTDIKTETREVPNRESDNLAISEQFEQIDNTSKKVNTTNPQDESPTERAERIDTYIESTVASNSFAINEQHAGGRNIATMKTFFHTIHYQKKSDGSITVYVEGERTNGMFAPNEEVGTYDTVEEAYAAVIRYLIDEKGIYETYPKTFHQYNDLYNERHQNEVKIEHNKNSDKFVQNSVEKVSEMVYNENGSAKNETGNGITNSGKYTSPEYQTSETRKPIVATDFKADKQRRADATKEYGLSVEESRRLENYVIGSLCYELNKKMISGTLKDGELKLIDSIRNALLKMPEYSGRTYRNLKFDNEKQYNDFLTEYSKGNMVELKAFTSTSKLPNGYPLFGNGVVHLVIDGVSGRDIADTFGLPRQQEVVYLPGTVIEIKKVTIANDGNPLIFVQEVKQNENIRTKETGIPVNNRPEASTHQDINGQGTDIGQEGADHTGLSGGTRSGYGRNGLLSERGKGAEAGNVLGEHGGIKDDSVTDYQTSTTSNALAQIEAREKKIQEVMSRFGLTEDEAYAVIKYKTAEAYKINAALRDDETQLNDYQKEIVQLLDSALEKLPVHRGTVYRTVSFDDLFNPEEEYNAFLEQHIAGNFVIYNAYTSTSSEIGGHPMTDDTKYGITLEVEGENGRDVDGFGDNFEKEVVYPRGLRFAVTEVSTDSNGRPYIKVKEIIENDRQQRHTEERGNLLQQMQAEEEIHGDLYEISERNTERSGDTENSVQGVRADKESGRIKADSQAGNDISKLTDKCELISTKHTATGNDIWVVTLKDRVSSEEYKDLSGKVKAVGGYYSRFAKTPDGKAIPGFVFKNELTDKEIKVFNDFFGVDADIVSSGENMQSNVENGAVKSSEKADNVTETESESGVTKNSGTKKIADFVADKLSKGEKFTSNELFAEASKAFGGTMADNVFTPKDAYDAMELGVNKYILSMSDISADKMLELLEMLPTQTKRTEEMVKFQQFSTPPSIAYLANYAANINASDVMLEPSAGIGGIAVFAKRDGAKVYVNELDSRRLEVLRNMPFDGFYNENAEQLDNILGSELEPTVIVMNPPFSSSSERNIQNTKIGAKHIEQALKILAPNGRLVAIVGRGMSDDAPAFRSWWKDIKSQYNVRANIGINGKNYNKYGTNFDIQMLVIDKDGSTTTETVTGFVDTLQELQEKLGDLRDERPAVDYKANEQRAPSDARIEAPEAGKTTDVGNRAVSDAGSLADKGKSADDASLKGQPERKGVQSVDSDSGRSAIAETSNTDVVADENGRMGSRELGGLNGKENVAGTYDSDSGQSDIQAGRAEPRKRVKHKELTDSIFEQYQTQPLRLNNTKPHPAKVSESAAMSAIEPPAVTYKPKLPQSVVEGGVLSDVQLEAISYAGQSHSQTLPDGNTRGFFLGDGTGIGKGRTIAGMMLDNYNQGRKKAVWVTLNSSLVNDAKRDVSALFGNSDLVTQFAGGNKADSVLNTDEAIMVISYSALAKSFDNKGSNFEKIVQWLGKDFDGLIVFDEAHKMGNATATKGTRGMKKASQTGLAGIALQQALPKAKIVYSSATGATEVENLRYAERLGLWGEGTAFVTGEDFVSKIKAGGLAAMELIARDMKAMGVYLSRNISYEDVRYDKITHKLSSEQRKIYDELARGWQIGLQNTNKALETTNQGKDGTARGRALGAFWSSQQRFFNQILTSMQVPSVISDIEKQLADGKSCVIQLVSTNEAAQNEEFARLKQEDLELDEFDLTPRQMLMSYIENSFPVAQFETYRDDDGNVRSKPVYDSKGNPVLNRDAVRQRDELLTKLGSIKVPSSPIDMIINHFGTDMVAENTGRARRVVQKDGKAVEEKIGSKKDADVDAFQNGNKRIIIFSKAGGTGKSYHADRAAKNQQQRVHYLLEAGWQADNAVQGFGRSHRSNQASAPIFKLVTTDLKGQMRFISTIAKRLDQLGAMTKGQRQAGGQGMFSASDNLENSFAADVLAVFYKDLAANRVDGIENGMAILEKLGLRDKILDKYNQIMPTAPELREVNKFLNRILSLESSEQNTVFDGYSQRLQDATEKASLAGTLDKGLENYKADRIVLNEVQDIREDERSGAKTKYYNLTAEHKIKPVRFENIATDSKSFVGFYQNKTTGNVRAVMRTSSTTDQYGNVTDNFKLVGQVKNDYVAQNRFYGNWTEIESTEAERIWNEELSKLPEYRKENLHLISGVVLPVWDKLPTENVRIYRVLTTDGEMLIGRVIPEDKIDETLRRLGSSRTKEEIPTKDLIAGIKGGDTVHLENGWKIVQRKVSGESRIELVGPSYTHYDTLTGKGIFAERINFATRYFIPAETNTEKIIDEILKLSPVIRVENVSYSTSESEDFVSEQSGNSILSGNSKRGNNASAGKQAERISDFKQKIKGKSEAERQSTAKELLAKGQTEKEVIDVTQNGKKGKILVNLVSLDAHNDDMLSIAEAYADKGIEVRFYLGNGKVAFDGAGDFVVNAFKVGSLNMYIRYDGKFSPQTYGLHEDVHIEWDSEEMAAAKDYILNSLSDREMKNILASERYKNYSEIYGGDTEAVWQEFIADVFSGMNSYTESFIDVVSDYWYGGEVIDRYSPAVYNDIIDAGGVNENTLNNIGISDNDAISTRFSFAGEKANTADVSLLKTAKEMQANGTSRETILKETGWFKGKDGKWRFEIDDSVSEFFLEKLKRKGEITLGEIWHNEPVYKAYPFLKNIAVKVVDFGKNSRTQGEYDMSNNTIKISDAVLDADIMQYFADDYEKTVMHEAQHAIQHYEEFEPGGTPEDALDYIREQAQYFLGDSEDEKFKQVVSQGTLQDIYDYVDDFIIKTLQVNNIEEAANKAYYNLHGEREAREAEKRFKLSAEDRLKAYPDYGKGAILRKNDTEKGNQTNGVSKTSREISEREFISYIQSNSGRKMGNTSNKRVRGSSGISQTEVSFSTAETDTEKLTPERKKEIFEQFDNDHVEMEKPTQKQLWGERAAWVAHNMTRVFSNIPERGERGTFFAEFRKSMLQWKNLPQTASFMVQDKLNKMTKGLSPEEFKTFSELVYFLDLQEEAQLQRERGFDEILLPNEITPDEVDAIVDELNGEASENVKQALIKRQNIWEELKTRYIELNRAIGFDTDGKFKRKNYYHHQVIEYMNAKGGTGSRDVGIKAGRGWLRERHGSTKAINTDFLAVEYKAMLQMQYDVYIAETLGRIKQQYDIKPQLENEAFHSNKKLLNDIIRQESTDKDGNVKLDGKGNPDSETYRQQKWYNSRIMYGFNGLFDLAQRGELPTFDGEYSRVVEALARQDLNVPGLYEYVGALASTELDTNATDADEQAVISARTVLKYTSQKKAWVKEVLGDSYKTWETLAEEMKDTHSVFQPRRGNYFYTKTVTDEDAFNSAFSDMVLSLVSGETNLDNADIKSLFTQYADTVRLIGAAYEQWVLPSEIVSTMEEIGNPKQTSDGAKIARGIVSAWKGWATSVNPLRTVKFGLRNLFGDLDAVIAGNPRITMYSKRAVEEIYQAMRHKNYSDDFLEWVERGGYTSMLFANEMDTEMQDKLFSHLKSKEGLNVLKIPAKLLEKYQGGVETVHNFREAILRYSAYLYYKEAINRNGGNVKDYVASNRYIVRGLNTAEDKAYQLSKDLLGAYDEVGKMGQTLRRYWIPFYSFTETNLKRYYRMFENIIMSDDKIPKKAGKLLLKGLMVNMFGLLMIAWNRLVMEDEDDELPPSARNVPHITLGKIGDDVYAFRQLGSFSEILEWFGLEDYKWTKEDLMAPVDKAWGMITPFVKQPVELFSGLNFYPSLSEPSAIRDKWQHFFNSLGVDDIYDIVTGKPTKGISEVLKGAVVYNYDYKESAYYEILDIKRNYQGKNDNTIYGTDAKSNALYYMKKAVRYKDKDAALKYLDEYFENGGTVKGIKQSFSTLNPMYGFTSKDTMAKGEAFIASLTVDEKEKLKIAQQYYEEDLMLPENVLDKLGKKGITDEEAKNVLRNYISAKCK